MTGIYPHALLRLIPPGDSDPPITPRVVILHVADSNASSLYEYFRDRSGGIESHFFIRYDGRVEQYRSIYSQADANLRANDFAVSVETQGTAAGAWTTAQLRSIRALLRWLHTEAGIPLRKVQKWDGAGVGYHVLFGSPSAWTPKAKSCPGPQRIRQFETLLVPWMDDNPLWSRAKLIRKLDKAIAYAGKAPKRRPAYALVLARLTRARSLLTRKPN